MTDTKITALTALTGANVATGDQFAIADVSVPQTKSITADELRKYMQGRRGVRLSRVTNQASMLNSTDVLVTFTAEDYDTDNCADVASANTKITIPSGVSLVRFRAYYRCTAAISTLFMSLKKNGSFMVATDGVLDVGGMTAQALNGCSGVMSVTAGDYFELNSFGGGNRVVSGAWLEMEILG